jgi:hypothetical protein
MSRDKMPQGEEKKKVKYSFTYLEGILAGALALIRAEAPLDYPR